MFSRCRDWFMKKRKKSTLRRWSRCELSEQASTEFIGMAPIQEPTEERRQSLPRRLLGRFLSERSINDEAEELKKLMNEHGMYHRHQTLQQRRRLKELLEIEERCRVHHSQSEKTTNDEAEELKKLMNDRELYNRHQCRQYHLQTLQYLKEMLEIVQNFLLADAERRHVDFLLQHSLEYAQNYLKDSASRDWTRLRSEIALLYRNYSMRANSTHFSSLPVSPKTPHTTGSKSEPAMLQKPFVAPETKPERQTMQPLSSLPYRETAV